MVEMTVSRRIISPDKVEKQSLLTTWSEENPIEVFFFEYALRISNLTPF